MDNEAGLLPKAALSTVTENVSKNDLESPKQSVDGETNSLKAPYKSNIVNLPGMRNIPMQGSPERFHTPGRITPSPKNSNLNDEPSMIDKLELKPASKKSSSRVKPPPRSIAK